MKESYTTMRRGLTAATLSAFVGLLAMPGLTSAGEGPNDEVFSATAAASLPNNEKIIAFDISYVDPVLGTYVLADRTNKVIDVVNTTSLGVTQLAATPPFAGVVKNANGTANNNLSGPDGVIIVRAADNGDGVDEVWAGDAPNPNGTCTIKTVPDPKDDPNGNCSTVKVIELGGTHRTLHVISTGGKFRADESCIDTKDGLFMTANNADTPPFGTIISLKTYAVTHQISFTNSTNGAEQCQWSPQTGMFYITIPGVNTPDNGTGVVEVINPTTGTIVNTFNVPLQDCSTPQGLAVGPNNQMMVGCNEGSGPSTNGLHSGIIINANSGSVIGVIPDESGPDEVYYNAGDGQYFLARSAPPNHTNQLLGVVDANGKQADQSVVTANTKVGGSAHSVAADAGTNKVFVPIPAGVSTVCSSVGASDTNGCIAVFTASPDDRGKAVVGRNSD
jgi:hypothetical protein